MYAAKNAYIREWKQDSGCVICGETDPIVLDADHVDEGTKDRVARRKGNGTFKVLAMLP